MSRADCHPGRTGPAIGACGTADGTVAGGPGGRAAGSANLAYAAKFAGAHVTPGRPLEGLREALLDRLGVPCHGVTACWERGRPARTKLGTASARIDRRRHGSPSALAANCRRQQSRAEAQQPPYGSGCGRDARAPRASRQAKADAVGVSGGRLLEKPTCTPWETPVCPRAAPSPCREDHSRKNGRLFVKTNHEWTRMNTNRPEDR